MIVTFTSMTMTPDQVNRKISDPDTNSLSCYNCDMLKTVQEKLKHMVIENIIYFRFLSTFTMQFKGGVFKILKNRPFCNTDAY